jgi:hypothetical protein
MINEKFSAHCVQNVACLKSSHVPNKQMDFADTLNLQPLRGSSLAKNKIHYSFRSNKSFSRSWPCWRILFDNMQQIKFALVVTICTILKLMSLWLEYFRSFQWSITIGLDHLLTLWGTSQSVTKGGTTKLVCSIGC